MKDRAEYAKLMRKRFSGSKICLPDGSLNHKYFKEKFGEYWGQEENDLLVKGIEEFGVGNWEAMKKNLFNKRVSKGM